MKIEILENKDYSNIEDMFLSVSNYLNKNGMVKDTFNNALMEREIKFPTGLKGRIRNIAIPHSDPEHVIESGYIVVLNKKPIEFNEMGRKDSKLDVSLVIFILSNSQKGHMDLLQKTLSLANVDEGMTAEKIKQILNN